MWSLSPPPWNDIEPPCITLGITSCGCLLCTCPVHDMLLCEPGLRGSCPGCRWESEKCVTCGARVDELDACEACGEPVNRDTAPWERKQ